MLVRMARSLAERMHVKEAIYKLGYGVYALDCYESEFLEKQALVQPYTMTSIERLYAVHQAVGYVVANDIPGDLVECGVWRGGASMMAALTLRSLGVEDRRMYLYDTFAGMTEPEAVDASYLGESARETWRRNERDGYNAWCYGSLDDVRENMGRTGYPTERIEYVEGPVEATIPATVPERIAILRLDTDWYSSTRHELEHLYPRLVEGGVLIIDDYGYWVGARKAVDEYIAEKGLRILLARTDHTGRMAVKQG